MFKKILYVFLISIVPVIELRAAIPAGAMLGLPFYWNYIAAVLGNMLPVPFILLFIPAVLAFMKRHHIFPRLVGWIERKGLRGAEKLRVKSGEATLAAGEDAGTPPVAVPFDGDAATHPAGVGEGITPAAEATITTEESTEETRAEKKKMRVTFGVCLGLFAFVAVPLPGTGAWTGALVASVCGLPKRYAIPTILLGVMTAGVIMSLASYGVVSALRIFIGK